MNDDKIHQWNEIESNFNDCLLLGNGASMALTKKFDYISLFDEAVKREFLANKTKELFDKMETQNFEIVLNAIKQARYVNSALGIAADSDAQLAGMEQEIRTALIKAVEAVHPEYDDVKLHLPNIALYMQHFKKVINLNYDLIVYWAMLHNKAKNTIFKDVFIDGRFKKNWQKFEKPIQNKPKATLVFYPHGSLILATQASGKEEKIKVPEGNNQSQNLLNTIIDSWSRKSSRPLFISEGTSEQKLSSIGQSSYLSTVHYSVLPTIGKTVTVYGCSIRENDRHIFEALFQNGSVDAIAVSVHVQATDNSEKCPRIRTTLENYSKEYGKKVEVSFFNAKSLGCWAF